MLTSRSGGRSSKRSLYSHCAALFCTSTRAPVSHGHETDTTATEPAGLSNLWRFGTRSGNKRISRLPLQRVIGVEAHTFKIHEQSQERGIFEVARDASASRRAGGPVAADMGALTRSVRARNMIDATCALQRRENGGGSAPVADKNTLRKPLQKPSFGAKACATSSRRQPAICHSVL